MFYAVGLPFVAAFAIWAVKKYFKKSVSNKKIMSTAMAAAITAICAALLALTFALMLRSLQGQPVLDTALDGVGGFGIYFSYTDLRGMFGVMTAAAWLIVSLSLPEIMKNDENIIRYSIFNMLTLGAAMGIFYAADFFTFFFFFEIMSFSSFMWVAHRQTQAAHYASGTYLGVSVAGGMAALMGIFIVYAKLGTLDFSKIYPCAAKYIENGGSPIWLYAAAGCMFAGFGAKAGAFPVHAWLPEAYTQAPSPASALLSGILSKTGVYGILLVTVTLFPISAMQREWGLFIVAVGTATMLLGGVRALLSDNLKTTLACSSMSQIGFMLTGIGMMGLLGGANASAYDFAVCGTILHMVNHSIIKLLLFLLAGVICLRAGSYELNRVRGFGKGKPFLGIIFFIAAAGISGVPLFNGYVSKTLLHGSISGYIEITGDTPFALVEYLFLLSGGLTAAYMLKLFIALFCEDNEDSVLQDKYRKDKGYISIGSKAALTLCAAAILIIGLCPNTAAGAIAAYAKDFLNGAALTDAGFFSWEALRSALISLAAGIALYLIVVRFWMLSRNRNSYRELYPRWLDMEKYVYRAVFYRFIPFLLGVASRVLDSVPDALVVALRRSIYKDKPLPYDLPEGSRFTHFIGLSLERAKRAYCAVSKKEYVPAGYEHKLALKSIEASENMRIIERGLSFGLFMFCVGLALTMIYLLARV